jgi:hypothetical protein
MSGFGEWRAHAGREDYGQDLVLNIGRETAPNKFEAVTEISQHGATVSIDDRPEGTLPRTNLRLPLPLGEVLYRALHRVFGHENQDGKVEALEQALSYERSRVDFVMKNAMQVAMLGPVPQPINKPTPPTQGDAT